jgi:hypothetical protein
MEPFRCLEQSGGGVLEIRWWARYVGCPWSVVSCIKSIRERDMEHNVRSQRSEVRGQKAEFFEIGDYWVLILTPET